jgi:hypothetical protein
MTIQNGNTVIRFAHGGLEVLRDGKTHYYNKRPMYTFLKTALSITEFYDAPYQEIIQASGKVTAEGRLQTPTGAELAFRDVYEPADTGFKVSRTVTVVKNIDDLGFATKIAFVLAASDQVRDYDYFAPANWYRNNEYAKPHVMGYDLTSEYFWRREVNYTLPLFAAQNKASGEMIMLSRWAADVTMRDHSFVQSEHIVDRKFTIGSIGVSKPESETINYLYYGFPLRKKIDTVRDGLTIDYVYPGVDGEMPRTGRGYNVDYMMNTKTMTRIYHPMEEGFTHSFAIGVNFGKYDGFYPMMRDAWRTTYARLKDKLYRWIMKRIIEPVWNP